MAFCSICGAQIEEGAICSCQQQNQSAQQQPVDQYAPPPNQYAQQPPNQYAPPPNQYAQQPPPPNQYAQQPPNQYAPPPMNQYNPPPMNQYGQPPVMFKQMQPGKTMIRVAGILLTIFGLIALIATISVLDDASWIGGSYAALLYFELCGTILITAFGITGIAVAANKQKAGMIKVFGIIILIYKIVDLIAVIVIFNNYYVTIGAQVIGGALIGFILPILYIVGASSRQKAQF